jgi:amino acid adenylation domain-containing protein
MEPFIFPASFSQQRLWFLEQLDPGKSVYHMLYAVRFETALNASALKRALNEIVCRHESLRTSFVAIDGQPMQAIAGEVSFDLPFIDLSSLDRGAAEAQARHWAQEEGERTFDLTTGPLLRAHLIRLSDENHVLVIAMHHIISDGWSMGVFLRELATLYEAFSAGRPSPLPELAVQYADYSVWQREWLQGEVLEDQLVYWRKHLEGIPGSLELAADRPRPPIQSFAGAREYSELPSSLADGLRAFSRREGVTFFMTLLAAFDLLLWRYSGQDDIVVGTPFAGRPRSELEGLIGLFANTLPLRVSLSGNPGFRQLLGRVRETALEAYAHQDVPFDKLVDALQPERSLSHAPLFQVVFALENTPQTLQHKGLDLKWLDVDRGTARGDLSLFLSDKGGELSCVWEYSTDLFDGETIRRMVAGYRTILESILDDPEQRIAYLNVLSEAERRQLIEEWNCATSSLKTQTPMQQLFEAQAELIPEAIAVVCGDQSLTYKELNNRANQLAHFLRRREVGPEVPVGGCLERSVEMIVALLGVLKAGGAYVPVDPAYPSDRVAFMLQDSGVPVLLTHKSLVAALPARQTQIVCIDDWAQFQNESLANPVCEATPENLAYVIYTSGSTGRPKGVEVTHGTVVHLFEATCEPLGFREGDIFTVVHSSAFDFSVWEIWGALLQSGRLVVVPLDVVQSPNDFYNLLCRERVTVLNQTPSALRELLEARRRALKSTEDWSVRLIVCGGDALDQELAGELVQLGIPVWNFYGPTENTVWTTFGLIEDAARISIDAAAQDMQLEQPKSQTDVYATLNSIGRPIRDIQVYLLDQFLEPVPVGVPGELFIGGDGLARGYWHRPKLTAEKFIPNPFSELPGSRLYRTGDLARYRRNGKLEFLGRIDTQVKLRGFRVELGEIETALSQHPEVAHAVVIVREDRPRDQRLVAYVVAKNERTLRSSDLRKHLQESLPDYMLPSTFVQLGEMPLTPNKKVDRRALPSPDQSASEHAGDYAGPRTPVEEIVSDIWRKVLGRGVGIHDNFFELGGHSLLATQVISRIRDAFQIELPLRVLFETPTVAGLADRIQQSGQAEEGLLAPSLHPVTRNGFLPLSFAQQRLWFLDQLEPGSSFYNVGRALRLRGPLDVDALSEALSHIVTRHESLRTSFATENEIPFQRILDIKSIPLPCSDLSKVSRMKGEAEAKRLAAEEINQPFDLSRGPLLRAKLIKLGPDDHVLVLTMHHVAGDGWSLAVLFRELTILYDAFANGKSSPLTALPVQYADYAVWQRGWLQGEVLDRLLSYWKKQLAGAPQVLELPVDNVRPAAQTFRGAHESLKLSPDLTGSLKQLSREEGVTPFMTCLAAFQLLISRWTGQNDLVVGTDVANRNRVETESLIGFFTNLLPLRARISDHLKFTELLRQIKEVTLEAYAHQDLPFEKLVEELKPPRDLSRNPLVQVLLVMQNQPNQQTAMWGLDVSRFELPIESSRFDLVLFLFESENGFAGLWLYNHDLFEPETIRRLSLHYQELLAQIVREPTARLDSYVLPEGKKAGRKKMEKSEQQQARITRLRGMRRKGVDLSQVSSVRERYLQPEQPLPLVIEPDGTEIDLPEWAANNKTTVEEKLLKHGAILFRGFDVASVREFERFASALCPELFGEYGDLPREELGGKVYGSTPYPADETILFHNESSHMHRWPMLIWFYCVKAAQQGGESPILDCRRVYRLMEPSIREPFEEKGLMYLRNFTDGLDVSWQNFFRTTDKLEVENYCRKAGMDFEWKDDGGLRTRQVCPAVVNHPQTGEKVFFNQVQLHHIACLAPAVRESLLSMMKEEDLPRNVYYGDGSPIEDSVIQYLGELYGQLCAVFPWAEHDVLMLNNMLVAHSRNPFVGERKIVVALGDLRDGTLNPI